MSPTLAVEVTPVSSSYPDPFGFLWVAVIPDGDRKAGETHVIEPTEDGGWKWVGVTAHHICPKHHDGPHVWHVNGQTPEGLEFLASHVPTPVA